MKIAVIGGSGKVGTGIIPYIREAGHTVKVIDQNKPQVKVDSFEQGDILKPDVLQRGFQGMDRVIWLAMGRGNNSESSNPLDDLEASFDVNVKALNLALQEAERAGIRSFASASTLNVYEKWQLKFLKSEKNPAPDATSQNYGFTKRLGEEVCRKHGNKIAVTVLRLCWPETDEEKLNAKEYTANIAFSDLAKAFLAVLERVAKGFDVCFATGDHKGKFLNQRHIFKRYMWKPQVHSSV